MKNKQSAGICKTIFFAIAAITTMFITSSCARKITFLDSSVLPAARGTAQIKQDKNKNYVIKLDFKYLAEPNRLTPPRKSYIVWMEGDGQQPKNIGQIKTSGKLNASFETVSPVKPQKIFVTGEDDASTQYPTTEVVLTTSNL